MCVCSGNRRQSNPRCSAIRATSAGSCTSSFGTMTSQYLTVIHRRVSPPARTAPADGAPWSSVKRGAMSRPAGNCCISRQGQSRGRRSAALPKGTTGERAVQACAVDRNRERSGSNRARGRPFPDPSYVAEGTPPPPGRPSMDARAVRGRRPPTPAATQSGCSISAPAGGAMVVLNPAAGPPSSPAPRPRRLAFYMGCCAYRGKGRLSRGECARIGKRALRRAPAGACCGRRRRRRGVLRAWD
jgi:hypothetical protein